MPTSSAPLRKRKPRVTSRLFATTTARERPTVPIALPATTATDQAAGTLTRPVEPPPYDPDSTPNMQDRKLAFLTAAVDRKTLSSESARQTGLALRRPGRRRDSGGAHHRHSLLSPGPGHCSGHRARLRQAEPANTFSFRKDRSSSASTTARFCSDRTACSWSGPGLSCRMAGRSRWSASPSADMQAPPASRTRSIIIRGRLFKRPRSRRCSALVAELGAANNDSAILTALRRGSTDSLNETGQQVVRRNLNIRIQPTITIRLGFPVRVIINRDLVLSPYRS